MIEYTMISRSDWVETRVPLGKGGFQIDLSEYWGSES